MASKGEKLQWRNAIQNHQNGKPLLVLDPKVKGYEPVKLYQWEMCVQFHLLRASEKEVHRKEKFSMFTENGKFIQLETFTKKATEIKSYLNYAVHKRWKNVSLVLH
eukprot:1323650-Ditylum_brightwellii.AAC.1